MILKTCTKCKLEIPVNMFNKRGDSDQYRSHCKKCNSIANSIRNFSYKDRLTYRKNYYIENKERENLINKNNNLKKKEKESIELTRKNERPNTITGESISKNRASFLKRTYNITLEDYNRMLIEQNYVCSICKNTNLKKRLCVDHCHETGKVRGLLCDKCNHGIGLFKDKEELLIEASEYLKKSRG